VTPKRSIALFCILLSAFCCTAAETLWDFVYHTTVRATDPVGGDFNHLRNDWGDVTWYADGAASASDYHVISTGFSIEQVTDPYSARSTTIAPNGNYLLTYGGRVAVADYGQVINRAFFESLAADMAFEATFDPKTYETIPSTTVTSNDRNNYPHIGYLVFEDKSFASDVLGYAWVEYSLYKGEFCVLDSGLVYGGDSSISVGTQNYTYVADAPEPTGGLLCLVGAAFLVLRRKV